MALLRAVQSEWGLRLEKMPLGDINIAWVVGIVSEFRSTCVWYKPGWPLLGNEWVGKMGMHFQTINLRDHANGILPLPTGLHVLTRIMSMRQSAYIEVNLSRPSNVIQYLTLLNNQIGQGQAHHPSAFSANRNIRESFLHLHPPDLCLLLINPGEMINFYLKTLKSDICKDRSKCVIELIRGHNHCGRHKGVTKPPPNIIHCGEMPLQWIKSIKFGGGRGCIYFNFH